MKKTLARWLQDAWYKEMYVSTWIMPFSLIYVDIIRLRRFLYCKGIFKSSKLPVPVIIVGNITVGGTGKTPLVIWLANWLREHGYNPGVISRGYGGEAKEKAVFVGKDSDPQVVGDEPVLIARHSASPMAVCADRVAAGRTLLQQHDCDVIVCDDGLQHYALQRDIEIAVIDGQRRFGNGYCLPAGPLREPIERLREVDLVIVNGEAEEEGEYAMRFIGDRAVNLKTGEEKELRQFKDTPCHALAGIGNPQRFFKLLTAAGLKFQEHVFPDHFQFAAADIRFQDGKPALMTEKDAVKCQAFADESHWHVPIRAEPQADFSEQLLTLLKEKTHG
ncbi:tetraacyldisaccharide 4'-kinase [Methylomarinum vadi]|uniref:tetraacyldisaccharide 4'-kinase n=1 Tax=Methylomarinum vadi TaxID=438855 RepID=UPI0004DF0222|nr:tetraacyldisaccharide 4'-kinase [Methylomarinum vadi]